MGIRCSAVVESVTNSTRSGAFPFKGQEDARQQKCVEQITSPSAAPPRGIVERHHGRQQRLDLLHAAGFRRVRTEKFRRPAA
jgi:hypothetical protein